MPDNKQYELFCSILSTVVYFDIFSHPLTAAEIKEFAHHSKATDLEFDEALAILVGNKLLFSKNGFYLPHQKFENIIRRDRGNALAAKTWDKAYKQSVLISKFPYVRSVIVSGSLSKGFMDQDSDIDFLIITQPGRLWVARTLLALYKKVILLNSHKYFCVNYFLDSDHFRLPDKNIFIATELMFAVPVYNPGMHLRFLESNSWAREYYPSKKVEIPYPEDEFPAPPALKSRLEKLLNGSLGNFADKWMMHLTVNFWQKKFKTMKKQQYERDMQSHEGVAKHHPNGFRDRVLHEYESRFTELKKKIDLIAVGFNAEEPPSLS